MDKANISMVKERLDKELISAYRAGYVSEKVMEAGISHALLMVLQSRQSDVDHSVPMDFDILELRMAVLETLKRL